MSLIEALAHLPVAEGGPLAPLVALAFLIMDFFHDNLGFGWGPSIVALTFVTRILILPLSIKQIRSMRALQALQPELKALQEKYGDDRQRLQQEMIRFYQENNVNPLASCIPLLLQLPIFIALFIALRSDDFRQRVDVPGVEEGWLFIDRLYEAATGGPLLVLVALYIGTQLLASLVMISTTVDRTQRIIVLALPFVFVPFIINFPAGLVVYWISTNVWTVGQQAVVKRLAPPPDLQKRLEEKEEEKTKKPPPPPPRKKRKRRSGKRR